MKRFIAGILAALCTSLGVVMVDKTIEGRVVTLESQVASLGEVCATIPNTTTAGETTPWTGTTTTTTPTTTLTTSRIVTVPDVYGIHYKNAEIYFEMCNLHASIIYEDTDAYKLNTVIRTSPERDAECYEGSMVIVYVARNNNEAEIPWIVGKNIQTAVDMFESVGLNVSNDIIYQNSIKDKDTVISIVDPHYEGKVVSKGTEIQLIVSNGKSQIPEIVGWDITTAKELLKSVGLSASNDTVYENSTEDKDIVIGIVLYSVGDSVTHETDLKLIVSNGIPPT